MVGLSASKSHKNLKENLSSLGASQRILNKILQDFERSDHKNDNDNEKDTDISNSRHDDGGMQQGRYPGFHRRHK
jgi:hypothetical protein